MHPSHHNYDFRTINILPRNQSFYRQITSHEKDGAVSGGTNIRSIGSCTRLIAQSCLILLSILVLGWDFWTVLSVG